MTIKIRSSATADSRTCEVETVSREQLLESSLQHINDVRKAMSLFCVLLDRAAEAHDVDKLIANEGFYHNFLTKFKERDWLDRHYLTSRHHLLERIPDDVNLIDVLEMIADWVMAGMGRSGKVRPVALDPKMLGDAVRNTIALLEKRIVIVE